MKGDRSPRWALTVCLRLHSGDRGDFLFRLFVHTAPRRIMYLDPLFSSLFPPIVVVVVVVVVVRSAPRLVLQSAREARVLPVPIVSCMINGAGPSGRLKPPRTPAPFGLSIPR